MKKLVILTKSLPDYTTGGNGNVLYHILRYLPKKFDKVILIVFKYDKRKINKNFIKNFPKIKFEFKYYFINDLKKNKILFRKNFLNRCFESTSNNTNITTFYISYSISICIINCS